jgi:hypothetical protein
VYLWIRSGSSSPILRPEKKEQVRYAPFLVVLVAWLAVADGSLAAASRADALDVVSGGLFKKRPRASVGTTKCGKPRNTPARAWAT